MYKHCYGANKILLSITLKSTEILPQTTYFWKKKMLYFFRLYLLFYFILQLLLLLLETQPCSIFCSAPSYATVSDTASHLTENKAERSDHRTTASKGCQRLLCVTRIWPSTAIRGPGECQLFLQDTMLCGACDVYICISMSYVSTAAMCVLLLYVSFVCQLSLFFFFFF